VVQCPHTPHLLKAQSKGLQHHPGKVALQASLKPSMSGEIPMATVPHPSAPREPLTTLVTALFGDQSTPASPLPASNTTAETHWQDAVTQVGEQLRAKLHVEVLPDRLHKALALVLAHVVTLHPDGTASVQSGKQTYRLAPDCSCADATHRAELCTHTLAVELHRRALALLDSTVPASSPTAAQAPVSAPPPPNTEAPPAATPPAAADTRQDRLPSADRWEVTEAPASCCLRLRVGNLEILYTMRDVSDAELTSRVQHLVPWVQDVLDQARERQDHLDLLRQQREATSAGQATGPQPPPPIPPADMQALIQQAVQQALAAQQPPSHGQAPATGTAPTPTPSATPADWCALHQVAMEQRRNATGAWWSHWVASEQRYCKGKA
jgi:hypothetical protein